MKYRLILMPLFFIARNSCLGQTPGAFQGKVNKIRFLYIVVYDNKSPLATINARISPSERDTSYGLPAINNKELCRLLQVQRAIFIKVKPNVKLFTLNEIFDFYKVHAVYRKWPVKINDESIDNPETILISKNAIDNVKIIKRPGDNFVNIIEKDYYKNKKDFDDAKKRGELFIQ